MYFIAGVIPSLLTLAMTSSLPSSGKINNGRSFTCRFGDDFFSEIECTLGDFNSTKHQVRTLNIVLPGVKYLSSSTIPPIRASRFVIQAPYLEYIARNSFYGLEDCVALLKIANGSLREIPGALGRLRHLSTLILAGNNIRSVDGSLKKCKSIRHLVLSDNRIATIDRMAFHYDLNAISLMNNRIRYLNGSLVNRSSVYWLIISHNRIESLDNELIGMESLHLLDSSWNVIKDISNASLDLPSLEILDLSHNEIRSLGYGLEQLHRLTTLDLSNNRLETLDEENFVTIRNLEVLDLSNNVLTWLGENVFDCLTKLTSLDMSFNRMKELRALISPPGMADALKSISNSKCDFRRNTPLKLLNVTGNPLKCDPILVKSVLLKKTVDLIGNPC